MSTLSRPNSSSSACSSPLPARSSSLSSSFGSSTIDSLSVVVVDVPYQVEVVRGYVPANAVDWSGSPVQAISRANLGWFDPKVVGISSTFLTKAFVSKFLDRFPILKGGGRSSFFSVEPCLPIESVCMGQLGIGPPFFYMYSCLFRTYMSLSLLTTSRWASFGR